jgi:hypothetical protein
VDGAGDLAGEGVLVDNWYLPEVKVEESRRLLSFQYFLCYLFVGNFFVSEGFF